MWCPSLSEHPSVLHVPWKEQSKLLYGILARAITPSLRTRLSGTYSYSHNPTITVHGGVKDHDGIGLMFGVIALYLEDEDVIRRDLRVAILEKLHKFKRGSPTQAVSDLRKLINTGLDARLRMPWQEVGLPIVTLLSARSNTFATRLIPYSKDGTEYRKCVDLSDSLRMVDLMLNTIDTACKEIEDLSPTLALSTRAMWSANSLLINDPEIDSQ